tara:strand:+ start:3457 stop:4296 length:840 start_codon:yes stop_codon:yes gene_type:complete
MNLDKIIKKGSRELKNQNIESYTLDAEIILSDLMGVSREFLITNEYLNIPKDIKNKYNFAIKRRVKKEPVAYITGKKEFWSENFKVSSATLVPRPETELLIYKVVNLFKKKSINILDIGTGSGCILLSILKELKMARGIGIDISHKAIKIAEENSKKMNLSNRVKFKTFNIAKFNEGKYDLIITNPPYIPLKDIKNLSKDIRNHEPLIALNGGIDGLDLTKKIIYKSKSLLKKNGLFVVEIGNQQYLKISNILKINGFREIGKEYDNNRNVRCIINTKM